MTGSSAFFILIPAMYGLFTLALGIIAFVDRKLVAARWATLGFFVAFTSIVVDGYRDPTGNLWVAWYAVATHFLPLLIMTQAFLSRHQKAAPKFAIGLTIFACIYVMPNMPWAPPNWLRGVFVQGACATIIAASLPKLWRVRKTSVVDLIAFCTILGAALSYVGRTVAVGLNPIGETREEVIAFYDGLNLIFHSASALMGMSLGIVLVMMIGYDMLRGRTEEGEIDPLTRLGNRRRLDRKIALDKAGRRAFGAVILIDLDHFKQINDRFGHDGGDDVLRAVGTRLNDLLADFGYVFRIGGEEFVVLIDEQHARAVSSLALSARKAIADLTFKGYLARAKVTASVGFHIRVGKDTVQDAMQCADQAVYCAKNDGRNRVVGAVYERGLQIMKAVA